MTMILTNAIYGAEGMFTHFKIPKLTHPLQKLEQVRRDIVIQQDWPDSLRHLLSYPLPKPNSAINGFHFLALDFETTGIEAEDNSILSIGCVNVFESKIEIDSAEHTYLNTSCGIKPESAIINHIVPEMLLEGNELDLAMERLFEKMRGKAILVHGAMIEKSFVDFYVHSRFGLKTLPILWIDTLKIEKHLAFRQNPEFCQLQLSDVRKKYHLPAYPSHNALIDSISCAELFLAQMVNIFGRNWKQEEIGHLCTQKMLN